MNNAVGVVILAAGQGMRLGHGPKALVPLAGRPMLAWALDAVAANSSVTDVVVVAPAESLDAVRAIAAPYGAVVVAGGSTRPESAALGLAALPDRVSHVAVGEAARPLLPAGEIDRLLDRLLAAGPGVTGILPGSRVFDTTHEIAADGSIVGTANREILRGAQTPQLFCRPCLRRAYRRAGTALDGFTDDAAVVRHDGGIVAVIDGDPDNFKITTERDLRLAELLVGAKAR
ncbi:2-C-methyl-D-erythritol 4-phosphate cytidylyltransferase [Amycolatopsis sp. NPDC059657]|uniref:IspD/TarI family cytidylyltransferase n=1 Tax=Amycolatopsis sp. NPDC059657 TaxID=3346899 RepID=UPI00366D0B85